MLLADEAKDHPEWSCSSRRELVYNSNSYMLRIPSPLCCVVHAPHPPFAPVGLEVPFGQLHGSLEPLPEGELPPWEHEDTC